MSTKPPYETYLLVVLLVFLSLGAIYGGVALIIDSSGALLRMHISDYRNFFFPDFFIPGMLLLLLFGIVPIFLIYPLLRQPEINWAKAINIYKKRYWAWTYSLYIGIALIIWINVQIGLMGYGSELQIIFSFYGLAIIIVCLLPKQMHHFNKHHKHSLNHTDKPNKYSIDD